MFSRLHENDAHSNKLRISIVQGAVKHAGTEAVAFISVLTTATVACTHLADDIWNVGQLENVGQDLAELSPPRHQVTSCPPPSSSWV